MKLGFIGGGNMAAAFIAGLLPQKNEISIHVAEPLLERRKFLEHSYQIHSTENNKEVAAVADILVLAVKPDQAIGALSEVARTLQPARTLLISIVAGVSTRKIQALMPSPCAIVRAMPNMPALIQQGITVLFANSQVSEAQHDAASSLLRSIGEVVWIKDEGLMDVATAISGSGPAYVFWLMERMLNVAKELGLDNAAAEQLVFQTCRGAAALPQATHQSPSHLRQAVTSKGGSTEAAFIHCHQHDLDHLFESAIRAAYHRSRELDLRL